MSDIEDDLRTTSEAIIADAERLKAVEQEKLALDSKDPRVDALAQEAEEIATRLLDVVVVERALAAESEPGQG